MRRVSPRVDSTSRGGQKEISKFSMKLQLKKGKKCKSASPHLYSQNVILVAEIQQQQELNEDFTPVCSTEGFKEVLARHTRNSPQRLDSLKTNSNNYKDETLPRSHQETEM